MLTLSSLCSLKGTKSPLHDVKRYECRDCFVSYRSGGHERQYRFSCPRCNLLVGYQSSPPPVKSAPYLYILKGALTPVQGQVPKDAFDLEDAVMIPSDA